MKRKHLINLFKIVGQVSMTDKQAEAFVEIEYLTHKMFYCLDSIDSKLEWLDDDFRIKITQRES